MRIKVGMFNRIKINVGNGSIDNNEHENSIKPESCIHDKIEDADTNGIVGKVNGVKINDQCKIIIKQK